jgi:hypothetical protein
MVRPAARTSYPAEIAASATGPPCAPPAPMTKTDFAIDITPFKQRAGPASPFGERKPG